MEAVVPETNPKEEKFVEEKDVDVQSKQSTNDSEYDSAASYSEHDDNDDDDDNRIRSRQSEDDGSRSVSETEEGSVGLERESGDGQESVPTKKVDDDEDKKNPQYIPKRGTFYEHDDRTADDTEDIKTEEVEKEKDAKKKVWQDKKERWSHDRFNDSDQAPKSRAELVSIYGYDIRNEDGPPRARRRRRYGRGPNKYTRNWEDEDAYSKPPTNRPKKNLRKPNRGGGSGNYPVNMSNNNTKRTNDYADEDFPQLSSSANNTKHTNSSSGDNKEINRRESDKDNNRQSSERTEVETNGNVHTPTTSTINNNTSQRPQNHDNNQVNKSQNLPPQQQQQQQPRVGSGRVIKPQREIQDSDYRGFTTKTRQYRNLKTEQKIVPKAQQQQQPQHHHHQQQQSKRNDDFIQSQNFTNKNNNSQDFDKDVPKLNVQDTYKNTKHGGNNSSSNQRQGSVPPRLQTEQKGSKRYSSIRQRSLPESQTPPFSQHSNYYSNEYNQQNQVPQQTIIHQQNTQIRPSTNQVPPQIAPPQLAPIPPQVPVTATTILQAAPPQYAPPPFPQGPPQPPPPTAYLQASVTGPPAFLPQQTPQIINYVPSQQFPQSYQGYQQQFNPVTQPTELYQQPSGITYYSTDQQVTQQRMAPLKRPKAAIPIVAPPPRQLDAKDKRDDAIAITTSPDEVVDNTNNSNNNNDTNTTTTTVGTTVEQDNVQQQ